MSDPAREEPCGILLVNKAAGCTSHDVVNAVRRLYSTRRVGHTGTLDPMATGLLVVLVGRAAKAAEYVMSGTKRYRARMRLGLETDTQDVTGAVSAVSEVNVADEQVIAAAEGFRGEIMQIPPMYSALKRNGKKLCDIARSGGTVELESRPVTIYALEAAHAEGCDYTLDVTCSGGTYIRTLCADIGSVLGCGAVMATLERVQTCGFSLSDAHTTEELALLPPEERESLLLPVESLFADLPEVRLPDFYEKLFRSGCEIYFSRLKVEAPAEGTRMRVYGADGRFFALAEVRTYEKGLAMKSLKLFSLD